MSLVFALVLLGCADDGAACEQLPAPVEHYATKAQCEAQADTALQGDVAMSADFPMVVSRCLRRDAVAANPARAKLAMRAD
jgi:hypothetical protein